MAGSRPPHLVPVPPPAETSASEATPAPAPERGSRGRGPWIAVGLLAVALVVCAGFLVQQVDVRRGLERQVELLSGSLARAEAEIQARRGHLDAVRDEVARIQGGLAALAELVAQEPAPPATPEPAPPAPPAAD